MRRGLTAVLAALLTVGLAACGPDTAGQAGQDKRSGQEAPKTFTSDRELVEEFLKDIQAGKMSRASELLSETPKSIQSDKDAKALSVRLSNASINSMNNNEVTVHFDLKGLNSERQMRLHLTDTTQGRRIETDSVVYPGAGSGANDITPAGLSEGMFFVPGLYGVERYDSSWRTVEKVPVDYDGADSQSATWSWNADKAAEVFRPFVQKRLDEVLGQSDERTQTLFCTTGDGGKAVYLSTSSNIRPYDCELTRDMVGYSLVSLQVTDAHPAEGKVQIQGTVLVDGYGEAPIRSADARSAGAVIQADSMDWDTSTVQSMSFGFDWNEVDSDSDE